MADRSTTEPPLSQKPCKRRFPCTYEGCNSVFKKNAHLLRHELIHNDERPFTCSYDSCGKGFRSPFHLKRHEATHVNDKKFKCPHEGCIVACITEWNLKRHIKRTHCGTFKCGICDKEFKKNKLLHEHTSLEHSLSTACCEFPGCGMVFPLPSKLKAHTKSHTQKGYTCTVKGCSMKFQLWSACRQHAAICKNKEQSCEVCGKVFTERSNLKAHMKIHSEEREVFQCTYSGCGRFYTKQSNLRVHIQSFHQNIRPFVCSKAYCNKSFHFQHLLRNHLELHAKNDDKQEPKVLERKRKRSRRILATPITGITGYVPSLWKQLTHEEVKEYIEGGISSSYYAETDIIPRDDETTQMEMTPVSSGTLDPILSTSEHTNVTQGETSAMETMFIEQEHERTSEGTITAFTDNDNSEEEEQVIFQPMKSLEEACSYLDQLNQLKRPSSGIGSSTPSSRVVSCGSGEEGELKVLVSAKNRMMSRSPTVRDTCHMQSVTESDSSDNEVKRKVRAMMQQCAS